MGSISPEIRSAADTLLAHCLRGEPWPSRLLGQLLEPDAAPPVFGIVVERLCDLFEPRLCDAYADVLCAAIARTIPELDADRLRSRYERIRRPEVCRHHSPSDVFVLSRVTLGADVAVTSIVLDAVMRRFPDARTWFVGARKNFELFAGEPRIGHVEIPYVRRGSLAERLAPWPQMRETFARDGSIVIDPDSRLTQLGLLPVCDDRKYYFFESRAVGGESESLRELTRAWVQAIFGADGRPWVRPAAQPVALGALTVSLGVGGNQEKRLDERFERSLMELLASRGEVIADKGANLEEAERVDRATRGLAVRHWQGDFATFAATIAASSFYVGYDSSGQHVASACSVPFASIFAGAVSERFFARWSPPGGTVIRVLEPDPDRILEQVRAALSPRSFRRSPGSPAC